MPRFTEIINMGIIRIPVKRIRGISANKNFPSKGEIMAKIIRITRLRKKNLFNPLFNKLLTFLFSFANLVVYLDTTVWIISEGILNM